MPRAGGFIGLRLFAVVQVLAAALSGCQHLPSPDERRQSATALAAQHGWQALELAAPPFTLTAFVPPLAGSAPLKLSPQTKPPHPARRLTVYIEGDGLAWLNHTQISPNPTPIRPTGLRLALQHPPPTPRENPLNTVAYLARPCQFTTAAVASTATATSAATTANCPDKWWTSHRFAPEVIRASHTAINQLMQRVGATELVLVGYSGGGAVAALVAALMATLRADAPEHGGEVRQLVTVAGNLDTQTWVRLQKITPLTGSLNPADFAAALRHIPQVHFVGSEDATVRPAVAQAFIARLNPAPQHSTSPGTTPTLTTMPMPTPMPNVRVIQGYTHYCCWVEHWAAISAGVWLD